MFSNSENIFWYVNQTGIIFEIIGAVIIVISAFRTRKKIKDVPDSWEANLTEKLRNIISNQAFTELWGFGFLAIGLVMQFIGGFE
ncbi:hypothetical protein [Nitrosomonas oligotropha]|uniref:hypothetical protein n=1 Tax=Nitrosomonas oligotropha TaxID=42354 RepID=UPI000D442A7B|nr:hypothetical protein [Nitrosomonas oligotropha]MXS83612.1 hypothetical protein [Nitrosomonas oligotropha]